MTDTDRPMTATDALRMIAKEILAPCSIQGLRPFDAATERDSLHLEFKRAWSTSCALSISFDTGVRTVVPGRGRRAPAEHVWLQRPRVEVCWSSTGRTVAAAHAALALYREVVELAALIEVRLVEQTIGWREEPLAAADSTVAVAEGGSR